MPVKIDTPAEMVEKVDKAERVKKEKKEKKVKNDSDSNDEEKVKKSKKMKKPVVADSSSEDEAVKKSSKKSKKDKEDKKDKKKDDGKKEKKEKDDGKQEMKEKKDKKENGDKKVDKEAKKEKKDGKENKTEKTESNGNKKRKSDDAGQVCVEPEPESAPAAKAIKLNDGTSKTTTTATPVATTATTPATEPELISVEEWRKNNRVTTPEDCPNPIQRFRDLEIPAYMKAAVTALNFVAPTPIQAQSWPIVFSGRDMIGVAETGSGKTLAFLVPAMLNIKERLREKKLPVGHCGAVVLAPTRELAIQIKEVADKLCKTLFLRCVCVYGGAPRREQAMSLRRGAELVIATPGRMIDFLTSEVCTLKSCSFLVLDEADRMLDMGFEPQIKEIIQQMPAHQTQMFSATWPKEVQALARNYQVNPIKIVIGSKELSGAKSIKQIPMLMSEFDKQEKLEELLKTIFKDNCKILVFCNRKSDCGFYAQTLWDKGMPCNAIHGDMEQAARERSLRDFTTGKYPVLFATDVAARGIDIKGVEYVINLDMPTQIENYVHRIGRTGRAGQQGVAYSFITKQDNDLLVIVKLLDDNKQEVPLELRQIAPFSKTSKDGKTLLRAGGRGDGSMADGGSGWGGGRRGGFGGGFRGGRGGFRGGRGRGGGGGFGGGRW